MKNLIKNLFTAAALLAAGTAIGDDCQLRGTGDLGIVIERASGSVQVVETSTHTRLFRVTELGDLSHAAAVFSRDERYAFVFGRDGGLSKVDLLCGKLVKRVVQSGNSIGGAISQDGQLIAVGNYEPGGVKIFDAETLAEVADLPATHGDGTQRSKVVGVEDASGRLFAYSLFDADEIHLADLHDPAKPKVTKFKDIGRQPYDALVTTDGRYYLAGLYGEDGLTLLDLWYPEKGPRRILDQYGRGAEALPVYKMPHLEGWASVGDLVFLPAVGHHRVLVVDRKTWKEVKQIDMHSQPVFVMARPDGRQVWSNFAHPHNDTIQVIDTETLTVIHTFKPGKGVMHMEFSPRGEQLWLSVRDENRVDVYDTATFEKITSLPAEKPSGIFFTPRAHRIGL
ncbi:MAG: cytochrome D1 domain-containing protein [Thiotrichales bacterium]